jgi:hypothetical protein
MAIPNHEPYRYLPITDHDGIRLIVLQPSADKAATVQCEILHVTLRQAQDEICDHYTALSYVWGDPNDTTSILVEEYPLRVTKSLERALRHLRDEKRYLNVWADGVCINQNDEDEKSKQVQQMGRVYETAHHTVIFLGECEPATEVALFRCLSHYEKGSRIGTDLEILKVVKQLLHCSWFYRVWILQELVISHDPRIQYGRIRFSWRALYPLKRLVEEVTQKFIAKDSETSQELLEGPSAASARTIMNLDDEFKLVAQMNAAKSAFEKLRSTSKYGIEINSGEGSVDRDALAFERFLGILDSRRGFDASDPRDLIFAHLGIAGVVNPLSLEVDYGKTTSQVYEMFAWKHISTTESFEVLAHIDDVNPVLRRQGLPSWVPNWTLRQANPRRRTLKQAGFQYKDMEAQRWSWRQPFLEKYHLCDGGILSSKGAKFESSIGKLGRVIDTTSYNTSHPHSSHSSRAAQEWLAAQAWPGVKLDLKGKTMQDLKYNSYGTIQLSQFLIEQLGQSRQQDGCILDGRRLADVPSKWLLRRLALVPASTKIGDLVFYLPGCHVPFIFRRVENGTSKSGDIPRFLRVQLIGECVLDFVNPYEMYDDRDGRWQQDEEEAILALEWAGGFEVQ